MMYLVPPVGRGLPVRAGGLVRILSKFRLQNYHCQRWYLQSQRIGPSMKRTLLCSYSAHIAHIASSVSFRIAVEDFLVKQVKGRPDLVILTNHRGKIANNYKHVMPVLTLSDKGDYAMVAVVAVYPLKAIKAKIHLMKGFFLDIYLV